MGVAVRPVTPPITPAKTLTRNPGAALAQEIRRRHFLVQHTTSCAHPLQVARAQRAPMLRRIGMIEFAADEIRQNLEAAMGMRRHAFGFAAIWPQRSRLIFWRMGCLEKPLSIQWLIFFKYDQYVA
jgi:hypothetical protein